ncbi:MAG: sigma-70 family RNA polymerase sigma factor [Solibacillus sp.]
MGELVTRATSGDVQAIIQLIEQDEDILYRTAYAYVKNEQDALDAMQELTYRALKKMHTVKKPEYARTWLMRVLINCCLDVLKKRPATATLDVESTVFDTYRIDVKQMLGTLSLSEQQLIYLKFFEARKNHEIAALQNIPEGTVKSRLHYILKKLRKQAGEKGDWL